jgi:hypothetical protein
MTTIEYYIALKKLKENDFNTASWNLVSILKCELYNQAMTSTTLSEQ